MPSHHRVLLALPPLTALVLTAGCSPGPRLGSSEHLDALLPDTDAYPEGFAVRSTDVGGFGADAAPAPEVDRVEPAGCERVLDAGTAALPGRAAEGAGQTAVSATPPVVYTYTLASGGLPEETTDPEWADLVDRCSEMTVVMGDGLELRGGLAEADSPYLPDRGGMVALDLVHNGMDMSALIAWGRVGDVHFVLTARDLDAAPAVSTPDLVDICVEVPTDFDCVEVQREERAAQARAEAAEEFGTVLFRAVRALEEGV